MGDGVRAHGTSAWRRERGRARVGARWIPIAVIVLAGACGSTQSNDVGETQGGGLGESPPPNTTGPANASGGAEASAMVGAAGGTFSLSNGARLEIPRGALSSATEVTLRVGADGQAFGDRENQRPLGPMLNVTPAMSGGGFVVSIPQQPIPNGWSEDDLALALEEVDDEQRAIDVLGTQTRWQFWPARVQNGRFVAEVRAFPGHRVQFGVAR
ncbi:MAG: hypothetical protein AB7S26_31065 [Sandaracinaceae bacterium]